MDENKFKPDTKRRLALRAGYLCSLCAKHTVGPSKESDKAIALLGDAAHIVSAELGGRRYDKDMTPEQRRNINNGIWLCKDHHKLVDSDECEYSIPFLKTIKSNHERKIELLNSGLNLDKGLVVNIEVENTANFRTKQVIDLSNSTLFFGNNGTGKTLLCDIISCLGRPEKIIKWRGRRNKGSSYFAIKYYDNKITRFRINYSSRNEISYSYNDNLIPALLSPYFCLYIEKDFFKETKDIEDIRLKLSKYFNLELNQIVDLVNHINKLDKYFVNDIYFEENELKVLISPDSPPLPFPCLSSGEKYRVILELALRLAFYYCKYTPTILIIEHSAIASLDSEGVNRLLSIIKENKIDFQFIFTSHRNPEIFNIDGFLSYELVKNKENIDINRINYG